MAQLTTSVLVSGLVGGLVATIVMTIVMMVVGDGSPPPTAQLVANFAGGEPADYRMPGMLLHLVYGTVAGAVLVALAVLALDTNLGGSIVTGIVGGVVWGIVLMVVGMAFWIRGVIGAQPDRQTMMQFGVLHVVYGLVLGALLGAGLV